MFLRCFYFIFPSKDWSRSELRAW